MALQNRSLCTLQQCEQARLYFCIWSLQSVQDDELDSEFTYSLDETSIYLNVQVNMQNNALERRKLTFIYETALRDFTAGV
jgi:hypothetical protein